MQTEHEQLAGFFRALAHPARLQILAMLRDGERCVCHIETALQKRQAYVSQQLMELREAGLVKSSRTRLQVYYWIADPRVFDLLTLMGATRSLATSKLDGCPCPQCAQVFISEIGEGKV